MRTRLTKEAMKVNDSPTTMDAPHANPEAEKYMTGDPDKWAETPDMSHPWDQENSAGREETGHPKMKAKASYAQMVHEAKELEQKALWCLKMAETILADAPADVIERQAVDFMTMSNKSVLSTLRRMREFEENVSESRIAKVVDAVMEVIAEEEEEEKEEKKAAECEEKKEEKKEEVKEAAKKEEPKEEKKEEVPVVAEKEEEEEKKIASIVEAVLQALAAKEEKKEEAPAPAPAPVVEEKKAGELPEALKQHIEEKKEEKKEKEAAKEEKKEEVKEEKKEEAPVVAEEKKEEKKEEVKEEKKEAALDISFDEIGDVMASQEDVAMLSQLFTAKEEKEEEEEKKEAKIQTLKNVTASKSEDEIEKLSALWK